MKIRNNMGKKSRQKKLKKKFQQRLAEALAAESNQPAAVKSAVVKSVKETDNQKTAVGVAHSDKERLVDPKIVRQEVGLVILLLSLIIVLVIIFLIADRQADLVSRISGWLSRLVHFY